MIEDERVTERLVLQNQRSPHEGEGACLHVETDPAGGLRIVGVDEDGAERARRKLARRLERLRRQRAGGRFPRR